MTKLRNAFPIQQFAIVFMTPNAIGSSDTAYPGKNPAWSKAINNIVRQAVIDFHCCFIDTFALWSDATISGDYMADHVHPEDVVNIWIASKMFEVIFPDALIAKFGTPKVFRPTLQNG